MLITPSPNANCAATTTKITTTTVTGDPNNNRVDQLSLSDRNRRRQAAYEMKIAEKNYQQEKQTTCGDVNSWSDLYIVRASVSLTRTRSRTARLLIQEESLNNPQPMKYNQFDCLNRRLICEKC